MDEVVLEEQKAKAKKLLLEAYVEEMEGCMKKVVSEKCYGCQVDHPSQRQHDVCLMMEAEERLELFFDTAWQIMSADSVFKVWKDKLTDHLCEFVPWFELIDFWQTSCSSKTWKSNVLRQLLEGGVEL